MSLNKKNSLIKLNYDLTTIKTAVGKLNKSKAWCIGISSLIQIDFQSSIVKALIFQDRHLVVVPQS